MLSFNGLCFKISLISDNILSKYYEWASFRDYFFISLTAAACTRHAVRSAATLANFFVVLLPKD